MYTPGRTTGDDVGKNHKKTTVRECYVSVDIEEMDNVLNRRSKYVCVYGGGDKNAFTLPLQNNCKAKDDSEDSVESVAYQMLGSKLQNPEKLVGCCGEWSGL